MKAFETRVPETWQRTVAQAAGEYAGDVQRMEHRWGIRRPCRARVSVSAGGGLTGVGGLRNISMSGAFLETALPLPLYAQLAVAVLRGDGSTHLLEFPAVVVRHEPDGVGIEWCDPDPGRICRKLGCTVRCAWSEGGAE
jgi:hypothetical protein